MSTYLFTALNVCSIGLLVCGALGGDQQPVKPSPKSTAHTLPATTRVERSTEITTLTPSENQYTVDCTVYGNPMKLAAPRVTLRDGEKVILSDSTSESFVVGRRKENGFVTPITREFQEGSKFEILVCAVDEHHAVVDVTVQFQAIADAYQEGKPIRVISESARIVQQTHFDEPMSVDVRDWRLEVTVRKCPTDHLSQPVMIPPTHGRR